MTAFFALLAILVPASVALVGHWYTQQSDKRLAQDRAQTATRLAQQEEEERARLRLDAGMRAGSLFGTAGEEPSAAASASGLLALTRLDHAELAVVLLVDLWSVGSPSTLRADRDAGADRQLGPPTQLPDDSWRSLPRPPWLSSMPP